MADFNHSMSDAKPKVAKAADMSAGESAQNTEPLQWSDIMGTAGPLLKKLGKDHNGVVSRQDLARAVKDPHETGQEAQALAALYGKFSQIATFDHGDGKTISGNSLDALYRTIHDSETTASQLNDLDVWTTAHFSQLDNQSRGYLTHADVTAALTRASGADREMLQMLDAYYGEISSSDSKTDYPTAADVTNYVNNYFQTDSQMLFTDSFEQTMVRTSLAEGNQVAHTLFANEVEPDKSVVAGAVRQGLPDDCSFNAPLGSLAQMRPVDVVKMFSQKTRRFI